MEINPMEKFPDEIKGECDAMTEKDIQDLADEAISMIKNKIYRNKGFDVTLAEMLFHKGVSEKNIKEVFNKVRNLAKQKKPNLFVPNDRKAWRAEYNAPRN
jgi:hypothetical protein